MADAGLSDTLTEAIGWLGVALYVTAYALVSSGRVTGRSIGYQTMNLLGAAGVGFNAYHHSAYPPVLVNVIWFAIAAAALVAVLRHRAPPGTGPGPGLPRSFTPKLAWLLFLAALAVIFGAALLWLALRPEPAFERQPLRVATGEWPLYIEPPIEPGTPIRGPVGVLGEEVFRRAGFEPDFVFMGWKEVEDRLSDGGPASPSAAFSFWPSRERSARFYFTRPLFSFTYVLFYSPAHVDREELARWAESECPVRPRGYRLGRVQGYALWDELDRSVSNAKPGLPLCGSVHLEQGRPSEEIETYANMSEAFHALARGEIDVVPEELNAGFELIAQEPNLDSSRFAFYSSTEGVMRGATLTQHAIVPRTRKGLQLRNRLDAAIEGLEHEGRLDVLRDRFDVTDSLWRQRTPARLNRTIEVVDRQGTRHRLTSGTSAVVLAWPDDLIRDGASHTGSDPSGEAECLLLIKSGPALDLVARAPETAIEVLPRKDLP